MPGVEGRSIAPQYPYPCRLGRSRDTRSHLLELSLCTVRPDPESEPNLEEQRLELALLPVRLRLDKSLLQFLQVGGWVSLAVGGCVCQC